MGKSKIFVIRDMDKARYFTVPDSSNSRGPLLYPLYYIFYYNGSTALCWALAAF
jgi:hypothetical protein